MSKNILLSLALGLSAVAAFTGCSTTETAPLQAQDLSQPEEQVVQEGDVLKVSFPGATNIQTESQAVRLDGRITLPMIGEVVVIGKTPSTLEKELSAKYSTQLVSSEVVVSVVSSSSAFFVTGEVLHPGKIMPNRPVSALEAIMEAGGFVTEKADMKAVVVIRKEDGHTRNYTLNLQKVLDGQDNKPFYLKPFDIVFVPQKFSMF